MQKMYEKQVVLSENEFRNLFGFQPEELPLSIILSPTLNFKLIREHFRIVRKVSNAWYNAIFLKLGDLDILFFKTIQGHYYHIDLINYLVPFLNRESRIFFIGAAGFMNEKKQFDNLYAVSKSFQLNPTTEPEVFELKENPPARLHSEMEDLSILSLPLISLENKSNLESWRTIGIDAVDMEVAYLIPYFLKSNYQFHPYIYCTDYPLKGDTFQLTYENIISKSVEPLLQFRREIENIFSKRK